MTTIRELSDFTSALTFNSLPVDTIEHLKIHLLDTIGAMIAGPETSDGLAIREFLDTISEGGNARLIGFDTKSNLLSSIVAMCAATRSTEADDIHLESCTTPGSVIIPTALALVQAGYLADPKDFLVAVALGYDLLIRMGLAAGGPKAMRFGIWPTYLGATIGSAAVTARALKLNGIQTKNAIATALALTSGVSIRPQGAPSSRWLTVGIAAQNGVMAALSAHRGFVADESLLEKPKGQMYGIKLYRERLTAELGRRFFVDETGLKPFPVARQTLPAVEAFQKIIASYSINPEIIKEVIVWVPKHFIFILDQPRLPANRLESASSVQYQIGLAAFAPDELYDVMRNHANNDPRIDSIIKKIKVNPSPTLERLYPSVWASKVDVITDQRQYSIKVLHPKGDPDNNLNWDEVIAKFDRIAGQKVDRQIIAPMVRNLEEIPSLSQLVKKLA